MQLVWQGFKALLAVGVLSLPAAGAAGGAAGGYLYDKSKKNGPAAHEKRVKDGQTK